MQHAHFFLYFFQKNAWSAHKKKARCSTRYQLCKYSKKKKKQTREPMSRKTKLQPLPHFSLFITDLNFYFISAQISDSGFVLHYSLSPTLRNGQTPTGPYITQDSCPCVRSDPFTHLDDEWKRESHISDVHLEMDVRLYGWVSTPHGTSSHTKGTLFERAFFLHVKLSPFLQRGARFRCMHPYPR